MNPPPPESRPVPAPPGLFFSETLPEGAETESASDAESRVLLDLETSAPLPVEKLAYGWVRLPSRELLYYATPRERVPAHDALAPTGSVLPDPRDIVFPEGVTPEDFSRAERDFHADLRPREVLALVRDRAAADRLLSRLTLPLRLGAVAGLVLLLAAGALTVFSGVRENRLAADAAKLKSAEERADMLAALERMEVSGHSIFDALALVNPARPDGVVFTRVILSDNRELSLEGRASDVSAFNRMAESLRASGLFGEVKIPKLDASGGRSTFSMKIPVTKWPRIADAPGGAVAPSSQPAGAPKGAGA